jgi:hypothetical protein
METLARVLLTLTVVGCGLITIVADFNKTHARVLAMGRNVSVFAFFSTIGGGGHPRGVGELANAERQLHPASRADTV